MATTPSAHSLATLASISPRKSGAVLVRPHPTKLKQSLPPLKIRAAGAPDGRINAQKSSRMTSASSQRTLCFEPSYSGSAERSKELRRMYVHSSPSSDSRLFAHYTGLSRVHVRTAGLRTSRSLPSLTESTRDAATTDVPPTHSSSKGVGFSHPCRTSSPMFAGVRGPP